MAKSKKAAPKTKAATKKKPAATKKKPAATKKKPAAKKPAAKKPVTKPAKATAKKKGAKPSAKKSPAKKPGTKSPAPTPSSTEKASEHDTSATAQHDAHVTGHDAPEHPAFVGTDLPAFVEDVDGAWEEATDGDDKKPDTTAAPRGLPLVEKVIETLDPADASPLAADAIAALTLPNGKPLPPSLARILEVDAAEFVDENDQLKFMSFHDLMKQEFDEDTATLYQDFSALLPGHCLLLEGGSDSRRFMYVGEPDALGEYPVFVVDTDDIPYVCIAYPGLDLYLAEGNVLTICDGTYEDCATDARYKDALFDQAKRNFHGLLSVELGANVEAAPGVNPDDVLAEIWGTG